MRSWYDEQTLEFLKDSTNFWWRISWNYQSNWRVLHVDGLEGFVYSPKLPVSTGKPIKFFTYPEEA
jgi:hypothetical protein